jgi:hypothetical protein
MTTMTTHAPAVQAPTLWELAIAAGQSAHGLAALTVTVHGEVMAVCVCGMIGYGADPDTARADLAHTELMLSD